MSSKITKKLSLSDKVGYITIGSLITQFGRIITAIVVARFVTKDIYGTYNQMFLIYGIFSPIFLSGIPGSILYFFPLLEDSEKRERFISQTISMLFSFGLIYAAIIFLSAPLVANYFHNPDLIIVLRVFSLYPILNFIYAYFQPYIVATHEVKKTPIFFSITAVSNLALMAVAVWFFPNPIGLAWASVLSLLPPIAYVLFHSKEFINIGLFRLSRKEIITQLKYAFPLGLASVIGQISYQIDRLIVSVKFSPAIYAIYAVGAFEVPVVALIGQAVNSVLVPEIAEAYKKKDIDRITKVWGTSIRKMALIVFPSFVVILVLADLLVPLLFSTKYTDSVPLFRIYLLLMPLRIASYGLILRAIGKTKVDLYASVYYLTVNAIINIILVNILGLWGPAIGTVFSTITLAAFYIFHIQKNIKAAIRDLLPIGTLAIIMLVAVIPGIIVYFLSANFITNFGLLGRSIIWGTIYLALYAVILFRTKLLTVRDKELFLRWTGLSRIVKIKL